jgi:hypothetical protein
MIQQVFQRTGQPIQLPNDENIALAELIQGFLQFGAIPATARGQFLKNFGRSCCF